MEEYAERPRKWPVKAYKNLEFLNSDDARPIRVLCEFMEPGARLRNMRVSRTVCFYGSARALSPEEARKNSTQLQHELEEKVPTPEDVSPQQVEKARDLTPYYEDAMELARRLAEWSMSIPEPHRRFHICSGGGPGIMEAANRGASLAGAPSIGLNISLPFEQAPNEYQSEELSFEFHYFFVRKFWFVYLARGIVVFPGGFGTFDELFELLTLVQTRKSTRKAPIVLYGSDFWNEVVNFEALADWGVISQEDLKLFKKVDDVDAAFEFLRDELTDRFL
jgi:hypothetical protein